MKQQNAFSDQSWLDKISNPIQMGGIELSVLDNGPARGARIAWVNTGSGLSFKVALDRGMDLADAFFNGQSLAWISHLGLTTPRHHANRGTEWIRSFGGGLMTTCGLDHTGGPEQDDFGERGLHGPISNTVAELLSVKQPDPLSGDFSMSLNGCIKQSQPLGLQLELHRSISMTLGSPEIRIHDQVINKGNTPAPHMLLYHFNFGWPLVDSGSRIYWEGEWRARESGEDNQIFRPGKDFYSCPNPLSAHSGAGEEAAFIDAKPDSAGYCHAGIYNQKRSFGIALSFKKEQLPWLTNWQHWGKGEYVTGLEPGTHPPVGQSAARQDGSLLFLSPGERRHYELKLNVLTEESEINHFFNHYKE